MKYRPVRSLLLIAGAAVLSACTVGPDYVRPEVVEPVSFKYRDGWQVMPPQSWAAGGNWWLAFEDDTLTQLVEQAARANQTLAQAEARYRAAEAQRRLSGSGYSPVAQASAGGSRSGGSDQSIGGDYSARISASWVPDLWGRVRRQVEADSAELQGSAAELAGVRLSIRVAVAQSYIRLRALDRQREILEQTMAAVDRSLELTRNQYAAGIVSRSDVVQAETQRQSLVSEIYDLRVERAVEGNAIAALLGKSPADFQLQALNSLPAVPALPAELPSMLIARRPDVVAAERRVAAANAEIGVARAAWLPDITLSAVTGVEGDSFRNLLDAPARFWSLGPELALTLFDGGERRAGQALALANYDEQVAVYRQTVLESIRDVEDALAAISILSEKAAQQDALVDLAEQNERVVTNRYKSGLVSFLEVATAQNTTLDARRVSVSVTADRLAAAIQLAAALGGGWDVGDPVVQAVTRPDTGSR